ncbi:unnamed protein product [Cuscuta campestris]|uniref:Uncharacterized protein n=1 Tax=Cuscuta campestris TaxID=132261 RepID=A0A484MQE9_9ASTE|nr:unnamed protein product [Cuscuta campestris]
MRFLTAFDNLGLVLVFVCSWFSSSCAGDELCPALCTEVEARRAASFAATCRSAPGSELAGARRPLKKTEGLEKLQQEF